MPIRRLVFLPIWMLLPALALAAPKTGRVVPRPAAVAPLDWKSLPQPDTTGLMAENHEPATDDPNAEVLLDDSGIAFGSDGSVIATTCKVFLLKSRGAATQFAKLPAAPLGADNSTTAFVVHATGQREAALSTREGTARFGTLLPGDRIVLISRIVERPSRPGVRTGHFLSNPMRADFPIARARFWVLYPTAKPAGSRALNAPEPAVETRGEYTLKTWRVEHQPGSPREKATQFIFDKAPVVFVDSRPDMDWLEGVCRGWLKLPAGPRLKNAAEQLRAQAVDRTTLLTHTRDFVAEQIQPLSDEDLSPEALRKLTPDGVLLRGTAGPFGRAALLAGLLRRLGFDPAIALVEPQRLWMSPPVLSPGAATPLVVLPSDKPATWLNPASSAHSPHRADLSIQGQFATIVGPLKTLAAVPVPVTPGSARGINTELAGVLDSSGIITGTLKISFLGDDADLWRQQLRPATRKEAFEMMYPVAFQMLFNSEPQDVAGENFEQLGDEVALVSKVRVRDLMDRKDANRLLRLPTRIVPDLDPGPRATPRNLLRLYGVCNQRIELELPRGWSPVEGRDSSSADGQYLRWNETRSIVEGKLVINREVTVLKTELPAADYAAYLKEQSARNLAFDRPVEFRVSP